MIKTTLSLSKEIQGALSPASLGKTLILTIGNPLRGDDAVAPCIAQNLKIRNKNIIILNVENKPENAIDEASSIQPAKVIFIDSADFGGKPGEIRIIPQNSIPDSTISTHTFPLKVIASVLQEDLKCEIVFIGIQLKNVALGQKMCKEVKRSADMIIHYLEEEVFHA